MYIVAVAVSPTDHIRSATSGELDRRDRQIARVSHRNPTQSYIRSPIQDADLHSGEGNGSRQDGSGTVGVDGEAPEADGLNAAAGIRHETAGMDVAQSSN